MHDLTFSKSGSRGGRNLRGIHAWLVLDSEGRWWHMIRILRVDQDLVVVQRDGRVALGLVRFLRELWDDINAGHGALLGVLERRVANSVLQGGSCAARRCTCGARLVSSDPSRLKERISVASPTNAIPIELGLNDWRVCLHVLAVFRMRAPTLRMNVPA